MCELGKAFLLSRQLMNKKRYRESIFVRFQLVFLNRGFVFSPDMEAGRLQAEHCFFI